MAKIIYDKQRKQDIESRSWIRSKNTWKKHFNELHEWINKYNRYPTMKENSTLYLWISAQRNQKKNSNLNKYQIDKLNSINFIWNLLEYNWNKKYKMLSEFKKVKDYWPKQRTKTEPEHTLAVWILDIRIKYKTNKLSESQIKRLKNIGFNFDRQIKRRWDTFYKKITAWLQKYNEFPYSIGNRKGEKNLYYRCLFRYNQYVNNKLEPYQKKQLDSIDFIKFREKNAEKKRDIFHARSLVRWNSKYDELLQFTKKENRLPSPMYKKESVLVYWIYRQRSRYRKNEMNQFQVRKLNELNIFLGTDSVSMSVISILHKLMKFREKNPHSWPSHSRNTDREERLLAKRLQYYRYRYKEGRLSNEEIQNFENINYNLKQWKIPNKTFDERIDEIKKIKEKCGKIDRGKNETKSVYYWIIRQRKKFRNGKLTDEQIVVLKENNLLNSKRINSQK